MVKVITYGTYDVLHYGHIRLLQRAKELGDYLIVGITSDDYDKTRGKINNQQSLMERIAAVKALDIADEIVVEEYEGQKIDDIRRFGVDIFAIGSDWVGKFDYLNEFCKVVYLPRTEGVSSSEIRAEKRKLNIATVGEAGLVRKFVREIGYVNGAEHVEYDEALTGADAVYIATHPEQHCADVTRALESGKHVICESPITLSVAEFDRLSALAKERHLILSDGIKTAYSTAYSRLLVVAKSGRIGEIVSVEATCTSLAEKLDAPGVDLNEYQNSICFWGPIAMLPVFQLLGTNYREKRITSRMLDEEKKFDAFTRIDFLFDRAVATVKVARGAKAEGELIITGTKGYIYVPAPWWKTDYFEVRFEDASENKRHFYQLDGEGIRYEIVAFAKSIERGVHDFYVEENVSRAIAGVMEDYYKGDVTKI